MTTNDKKLFAHMYCVLANAALANLESWNTYKNDYEVVVGVDNFGSFRFFTIHRPSCDVFEFTYNLDWKRLQLISEVSVNQRKDLIAQPTNWGWFRVEFWGTYAEFIDMFRSEKSQKALIKSCGK